MIALSPISRKLHIVSTRQYETLKEQFPSLGLQDIMYPHNK